MDDLKRDIIEPTAEVCTWKGDLEGALSLTYDDGLNSHIKNASPMMSSRGINGTFFVTTNNVGIPYGGTWSEWQAAADNGHEIGSHTITHPDLTACSPEELREEIVLSKNIIESNLTDVEVDTFSYPMGRYNETVRDLIRDHYIGARTDRHNISGPPEPVPSSPPDLYSVVPVNFGGGNTADELNALVNDTLGSNGWLVEMIHAVGSGGYDPVLLSEFSNHLDLISTKRSVLMVDTFSIILKYIKLRDNAELVSNIVDDVWNLSIDTALDPEVYDVPLTINVTFPSGWIDIEALIRGEQTRFTTNGTEVGSWALVEIGSKEDLCFFRSNIHPSIEQYSPDHGSDLPFSPMNGTSSNVYTFYLNYSSEANRAPMEAPLVHIDIYGDGSQIIVHNMTRVNPLDLDHTDGCIFSWNCTFPPGTCIQIRFSANDTEGLDAVSSSNMTEWMNGPILNDPPLLSGAPLYSGRNGKHPFFNWTPAVDPDGDNISYRLDLNIYTTTLTRYTTNTSFELDWNLHLNNEYWLNLTSIDDRGGVSETLRTHYNLSNEAPPMPDVLNITLNRWGNVDVWFSPVEDPDGDRVRYQLNVYKEEDLLKKPPIRRSYDLRENHVLNISFIERTKYYFFACAIDIFNVEGASTAGIFFHNDAPSPVTGLIVSDLEDNENGLMIQWNASFEEDLDHYTIYRWDEGEGPFDTGSASSERETGTNTTFIDRNVTDGKHYWYAVIAHDGLDSDLENFTVVYGSPVDDVAPLRIEGTTAVIINDTDTFNVNLGWRPSNDTRFREYRIYRSPCSLENISLTPYHMIEENRNTTSFTDENVQWNTTYWYTVTAVDVFGNELKNGTLWVNITCNPPVIEVEPETGERGDGIPIWPIVSIVILVALVLLFIMSLRVFKYPEEE